MEIDAPIKFCAKVLYSLYHCTFNSPLMIGRVTSNGVLLTCWHHPAAPYRQPIGPARPNSERAAWPLPSCERLKPLCTRRAGPWGAPSWWNLHADRPMVLNLVGGTEPHKFYTCIHWTLRSWKNKMCVVNFILFIFIAQKSLAAEPLKLTHRTPGVRSNPD